MLRSLLASAAVLLLGCADGAAHNQDGSAPTQAEPPAAEADVEIPAQPAGGQIHGFPFIYQDAVLKDGILTLRQGEEYFPDLSVMIFLFLEPGEVPSGRVFGIDAPADSGTRPHVHLSWKDPPTADMPKSAAFLPDAHVLRLELGQAADKKLPGKIYLSVPDEFPTRVSGTFEADIEGFILTDGEADLMSDAVGTVQWVVERYIRQSHPDREIESIDFGDTGLIGPHPTEPAKIQYGWCDVVFRVAGDPETAWRMQLVKGAAGWAVHRQFDPATILTAHPVEEPNPGDAYQLMRHEVARRIEADLGGQWIYSYQTRQCTNDRAQGTCRAEYRLGDRRAEKVERAFLFEKSGSGWRVVRELAENER